MPEVRMLFTSPDLVAGEFVCRPGDPLWRRENWIGRGHHVVFPRRPVWIRRDERVLATPNHAVFYNDGDYYARERVGEHGDHSIFLIVGEPLIGELTCEGRFGRPDGLVPSTLYARQWCVAESLRRGDPLGAHEALLEILAGVAGGKGNEPVRGHRDAVEAVKLALTESVGTAVRLEDLAATVHLSPFHLARQFRRATGYTIRGFRTQLRLRAALDEIESGSRRLADVAVGLGFASHSHFTDAFRRNFGVAPSAVARGDVAALRKKLEAGAQHTT